MADLTQPTATAKPAAPKSIVARYVRPGAFINGIPARDLTLDEWNALTEDRRADCVESGVYELAKGTPKPEGKEN